ncbi:class I SAM-dependent methyltransferase [Clostridium omnivorum]|uniref:S-adenosylmethionine-dependent methyltransferase n=1 Tax=Clostridium omnivorum TaxID=1604902 RepID=A0ABQ5N4K6_9CLOT|nr:class I SAM-dependent methyltransferase [Clostridium sp. E14]GLC30142.1 S-adenosylmethionine-dependent methyltransferase [Clostridium sp. E14]
MDLNLKNYYDNISKPWGKLFYHCVWNQLGYLEDKLILDFGSGFGVTANYLAKYNNVVAVEPNEEMIMNRYNDNEYIQINGSFEWLIHEPDNKYDCIICHNVIEYMDNRSELLQEFGRILKPNGFVSIVKHNRMGKIMQKAVFEYNIEETEALLKNRDINSQNFGVIKEYDNKMLEEYSKGKLIIDRCYGIRTFYGLQNNSVKSDPKWMENMLKLELEVSENQPLREIAFFHHIIMRNSQCYENNTKEEELCQIT